LNARIEIVRIKRFADQRSTGVSYFEQVRLGFAASPGSGEAGVSIVPAPRENPIFSYNQTDFVKERIALEVQFGKYSFVAYDLFVKPETANDWCFSPSLLLNNFSGTRRIRSVLYHNAGLRGNLA